MKLPRRQFLHLAAGAAALPTVSRIARAQTYPARPVRIIVPAAPGGAIDIVARLTAQKLTERFGKQFYVENISSGGGNIAVGQAARAAPDGQTLLFTLNNLVLNQFLFAKIPYDPQKDFEPVTLAVILTNVLTVNPAVAAKTVTDLVALIRANPGKYNFASPSVGSPAFLAGEKFRQSLGLDVVAVPFNGGGPEIASIVAGHTPIGFSTLPSADPQIKEGNLRPLAITSKKRSRLLPQVPTMEEAGYPEIDAESWVGVLVPAGTPKDIVGLLNREIAAIIALPDISERFTTIGFEPVGSTPEEFATRIKVETETWGKVIQASNIKLQ
jgi:tripartite-type tricarboxylate transporter receptor subunit TctC